jgi:hypothetical protein
MIKLVQYYSRKKEIIQQLKLTWFPHVSWKNFTFFVCIGPLWHEFNGCAMRSWKDDLVWEVHYIQGCPWLLSLWMLTNANMPYSKLIFLFFFQRVAFCLYNSYELWISDLSRKTRIGQRELMRQLISTIGSQKNVFWNYIN